MIQSIVKANDILRLFIDNEELGISEIVELTGMSKSTVHDTVSTLVKLNYLTQNNYNKKYLLGHILMELGYVYNSRNTIVNSTYEIGKNLSEKFNTTVHIATHDKGDVLYLNKFESPEVVFTSVSQVGKRLPMPITGLGKAMLAYLPEEYFEEYIAPYPLTQLTEKSITDMDHLRKVIKEAKVNGYATDEEEVRLGMKCVAVPLFDYSGEVSGAISVTMLSPYMTDEVKEEIIEELKGISGSLRMEK